MGSGGDIFRLLNPFSQHKLIQQIPGRILGDKLCKTCDKFIKKSSFVNVIKSVG